MYAIDVNKNDIWKYMCGGIRRIFSEEVWTIMGDLTCWGFDKMAAILQTTFLNSFYWK